MVDNNGLMCTRFAQVSLLAIILSLSFLAN
jgi:hypothetical protein